MTAFNMKRMGKRVLWMGTKMVQVETGKYGWSVITVDGNTWFAGYNDFDFFWQNGASQAGDGSKMDLRVFSFFYPFRLILALKLAKSANISKRNFPPFRYGYHKRQNSMLSLNILKKVQNSSPKKL
jgi:hypothetical protein